MSLKTKRVLFSLAIMFVLYFGIIPLLPAVVFQTIFFAISGWYIGGWIFELSSKIIKDE